MEKSPFEATLSAHTKEKINIMSQIMNVENELNDIKGREHWRGWESRCDCYVIPTKSPTINIVINGLLNQILS